MLFRDMIFNITIKQNTVYFEIIIMSASADIAFNMHSSKVHFQKIVPTYISMIYTIA